MENISTRPNPVFRNNICRNNRARSILVTAGGKVVIEGLTEEHTTDLTACEGVKFSHNQFSRSTRIETNPTSAEIETTANQGRDPRLTPSTRSSASAHAPTSTFNFILVSSGTWFGTPGNWNDSAIEAGGNTYSGTTSVSAGTLRLEGNAFSTIARNYSISS